MSSKHKPIVSDIKGAIAKKLLKGLFWLWVINIGIQAALRVGPHLVTPSHEVTCPGVTATSTRQETDDSLACNTALIQSRLSQLKEARDGNH